VLTLDQQNEIVRLATENAEDITNQQIAYQYGVSAERIRQIVKAHGAHKPRKLGQLHDCQAKRCKRKFRGTKSYSGHKARYCTKHRRK
jgi:hypothetical protein